MSWSDHLDDSELGNLPPEVWGNNFDVDGLFDPDDLWIENTGEEEQRIAVRECFTARFCDPARDTHYNGREGGLLSEPFFFAPKPCIHGLPTSNLKDAATSLFQKVSFFCRFLSLFSVFLRTRPQGEPRLHACLREVV